MKSIKVTIIDEQGLHARPASVVVGEASKYKDLKVEIKKGDKAANLKSVISVMGLGVAKNDIVEITAEGSKEADEQSCLTSIQNAMIKNKLIKGK